MKKHEIKRDRKDGKNSKEKTSGILTSPPLPEGHERDHSLLWGTVQLYPCIISRQTWYPIWWLTFYVTRVIHFSSVYIFSLGCLFQSHSLDCQMNVSDLQIFISCQNLSLGHRFLYSIDNGIASSYCPRSISNSVYTKLNSQISPLIWSPLYFYH